jgi:hypothetical protein
MKIRSFFIHTYCLSSLRTRGRDCGTFFAALIALAYLTMSGIRAQAPDEAAAQRVREILAAHCPSCRDIGAVNTSAEPAALDLAAIARNPNLVRSGNPDGSPAYTAMIRRLFGSAPPTIEDVSALRSWIENLPPSAASCPQATEITRSNIEPLVRQRALALGKSVAALRILTFAHLDAGCISDERIAAWHRAIGLFLAALSGTRTPVPTHPLDAKGHLIAVDIQALNWDGDHWRTLTGVGIRSARSNEPLIVRGDWLIVHVLRGELGARLAHPNEPIPTKPQRFHRPDITDQDRATARAMIASVAPPDVVDTTVEILLQLARLHLAPAGMARVAAELGVEPAAFERAASNTAGAVKGLLLRLAYGTIPREEIEEGWLLFGRILSAPPPVRTNVPVQFDATPPSVTSETQLDVALYADRIRYAPGDTLQITVRPNVDCHLTLISIDVSGQGTVIFPNDFATNNLASAQLNLSIPDKDAGYRFRVKEKGRERIVALCTRTAGIVDGIRHDFERQRFQELGPYSAFLEQALKRRVSATDDRDSARPVPQNEIWRTGILVEVE